VSNVECVCVCVCYGESVWLCVYKCARERCKNADPYQAFPRRTKTDCRNKEDIEGSVGRLSVSASVKKIIVALFLDRRINLTSSILWDTTSVITGALCRIQSVRICSPISFTPMAPL